MINSRRKVNEISGLEINGSWTEEPATVKDFIREHFRRQFQKKDRISLILPADFITIKLSANSGQELIKPFTEEEIKEVVFECDNYKSSGPDGFNFHFFKSCWFIIKTDLLKVIEEFHSNGRIARGCNTSFIVLIPKKEDAVSLDGYRPISLIGSLYKVTAKILTGRIRRVMEDIISDHQSAFIKGRYILDNVVILNELIEDAKKKRIPSVLFKIDFAKA